MDRFETNAILNEAALSEIKYQLMPRQRTVLLVSTFLALCLLILTIAIDYVLTTWVAAVALVVFVLEYFFIANRNVKVVLKRIHESAHGDEYRYTTSFTDSGMLVVNHTMESSGTIFYQDIKYVEESPNFFILLTKAGQFALLDKTVIDGADQRQALKAFLQSRNPRIRWKAKG